MLRLPTLTAARLVSKTNAASASITLKEGEEKCGQVKSRGGSLTISTGADVTPNAFKKAFYATIAKANQLKKESDLESVAIKVDVSGFSLKGDETTNGLFWGDVAPPKAYYGKSTDKSIVFERAATYASLSSYRYNRFKKVSEPPASLFLQPGDGVDSKALQVGNIIAKCVSDARNLGNLRHDEGNPASIADWIESNVVGKFGIRKKHLIVGEELTKGGINMLHAVGKGATNAPRLMVLEYLGASEAKDAVALVGKGVTFDCGGLNVKPFGSMETMHLDKMGAVAVVNALRGVAELGLPVNIVAAVGLVENAIGPTSYHPSTILRSLNGKTVEVTNTDAEGRLVLADMLTFVQNSANVSKKVTSMIDLATLTGAIVAALGDSRAGIFSNNAPLLKGLMNAGSRVDEPLWPMPIGAEHREQMKGKLSDLTNCRTKREGGACTAAAFLQEFVNKDVRWAHIDIAGPAMEESEKSVALIGAPGFGVQLLIDYFRNL